MIETKGYNSVVPFSLTQGFFPLMSDLATWYYVGSFGQLGPLTKEQLEELIEGGVIEKQTYVWRAGMGDWLPASSVPELTGAFQAIEPFASPPPTPSPMQPMQPMPPMEQRQGSAQPNYAQPMQQIPPMQAQGNYPRPSYGYHMPANMPRSDKSRTLSGVLQLLVPGVGRIYMGYSALGVIQLIAAIITCGTLHVWSIIDGVLILSGQVRLDGYGRALED